MNILKKLDYFTKPKEEVDVETGVGGLMSLIGICVSI